MDEIATSVETKSALSSAAGVLTIPANKNRQAIILGTPVGFSTYVILGAGSGSNVGPAIPSGSQPLILNRGNIGTGVELDITLVDSAGAQRTFAWIEILACVYTRKDYRGGK